MLNSLSCAHRLSGLNFTNHFNMKNPVLSTLAFLTIFSQSLCSWGQNSPAFQCASDEAMQSRPELMERQQSLEKAILQKNKNGSLGKSATPPYTLPVVVHIVHDNGVGDIPDAQVFAAMEQLNQAFAHQGYYADLGDGFDTQIQFCLAKRNPEGIATDGITRTNSPLSNMDKVTEDQALKDLSRWNPTDYINIWIVNAINSSTSGPGVVGYAYLASAHGEPFDGIVCEADYFGTSPEKNTVLIHEMGHYLNLYHTFQGGCPNSDCLTNGDRVCDTPPDQVTFSACGYNSCDTDADDISPNNPLTTNVADRTENYMDYSPLECYHAFSEGQATRMQDAIEIARSSLLESKGCIEPCTVPITADFIAASTEVFAGETVSFTNLTSGGTVFEWSIGGSVFSTGFDADFTFNDVGVFKVVLNVGNDDANCQETASVTINVKCPVVADFEVNATELEIGETFVATNTSQNATGYEWRINGVLVSTDVDLSYVFSNDGIYTVLMIAKSNNCSDQVTQFIEVAPDTPCPDSITGSFYQLNNAANSTYLNFSDMHSNGDVFLNVYHPWVSGSILKTEQSGNILWSKTIQIPVNGFDYVFGTNIQAMPDGGCIASFRGSTTSKRIVFKTDADGNTEWSKMVTPNIFYNTRGLGNDVMFFGGDINPKKFRAARLDKNGNEIWNKVYNLETGINFFQNTLNADSTSYWLVGHAGLGYDDAVALKISLDGELFFIRKYVDPVIGRFEFTSVDATTDGGFIAVGRRSISGTPTNNEFLICKANSLGQVEWTKRIEEIVPPQAGASGNNVLAKPDGSGYIAQYYHLGGQTFWLSFSLNGELEYAKSYYWDNGGQVFFSVVKMNGLLFATGRNPDVDSEMFVVEYDPAAGPNMGCIVQTDKLLTPVDFDWQISDYTFSLSSESISVENTTITELPDDYFISKRPFCSEELPCPEDCTNSLDDDEDGYVDCFDSDCQCFDGEDCSVDTIHLDSSICVKLGWQSSQDGANTSSTPIVANMNPQVDDMPEIIIAEGYFDYPNEFMVNRLLFYQGDGSNLDNPDVLTVPEGLFTTPSVPVVGDVNSDGIPELAIVDYDSMIQVFTGFSRGNTQAMSLYTISDATALKHGTHLGMADFNEDGIPELYGGKSVFQFDLTDPNNPLLQRKLVGSGHEGIGALRTPKSIAVDMLSVDDCNGDPDCEGLELICGANIYSIDLDHFDGDGLEIKIVRDLNLMTPSMGFEDGFSYISDVNLDGQPDVVTSGRHGADSGTGIYIWDKNGLIEAFTYPGSLNFSQFKTIAIANVFDDRTQGFDRDFPEIISTTHNLLIAFNLQAAISDPFQPYWWTTPMEDGSTVIGPACFDLNGDGLSEIMFRDEKEFRVVYGGSQPFPSGVDSSRNWFSRECRSATFDEHPVIADVDNDGEAEIVVTGDIPTAELSDFKGRLWVFESNGKPWQPARPIWNQHQYFGLNVNDDLTIPKNQQARHLEFPSLGSGKRPYNMANSQIPVLDKNFDPYFLVPDATVFLDSSKCAADSLSLWLTICNQGSKALPNSTPISFYQNDPTAGMATLIGTALMATALPVDSCFSFPLKIPAVYNTPIFVVTNDNGTLPTPFDPVMDFPNTNILECDYENNLTYFEVPYQVPTLDLGPDIVTCNSSTNTLNAGSGFVKYRWQDGSEDSIFTAWLPGKYWVDAWDVCGFKHTDTLIISLDQTAAIDLGDDLTICEGETVSLSVNGYPDVQWWPADGLGCSDCPTTGASPTASVTYYATATDGDCFTSDSIRITVLPKPDFTLDVTSGGCSEPSTITATTVSGPALDYVWSNGSTEASIQVSQSGTYAVTVSNPAYCTVVDSILLAYTGSIEYTADITPILCFGEIGSIELDVLQTAPPYIFNWSNGATSDSLSNLPPGNYSVTITDANGCITEEAFVLDNPQELTFAPAVAHISCNNDPGHITLHAAGGTGSLSYAWSNGGVGDSLAISSPGGYAVTVSDDNGCTLVFSENITAEAPLSVTILFTEIQCHGGMDGSAKLTPLNGIAPYSYLWENGQTDSLLTGLGAEPHSVTITDAKGCEKVLDFNLLEPDPVIANLTAIPVQCFGETTGSATAAPTGGSPGYAYQWSVNASTATINNLPPGWYTVTVTDEHGCKDTASILVEEPPLLEVTATADPSEVCPSESGDLIAIAAGGSPPYTYLWGNMISDSILENVPPGIYEVLVTDANDCEVVEEIMLEMISPPIFIQDTIETATGAANADGAILLEMVTGGTSPFSFLWSNGDTTQSIAGLLPGIYSLTITDGAGCKEVFEFEVGIMVGTGHELRPGFEVSLFPNPVLPDGDAVLFVKSMVLQHVSYKLFDVTGRLYMESSIQPIRELTIQPIKAPHLADVYFMQIIGENGQQEFVKWVVAN